MSAVSEPVVENSPPRRLGLGVALGFSAGLLIGVLCTIFDLRLHGWDPHEVSLSNYLVVWPAIGAVVGYLRKRRPRLIDDDGSEEARDRQRRRRERFVAVGFAIGLGVGFVATGLDVAWRGWSILPSQFLLNLVFLPHFAAVLGFNLSRGSDQPKWSWRSLRFNMRTLMALIAYVALLLGLGVVSGRMGIAALRYHRLCLNAKSMVRIYDGLLRKEAALVPIRLRNAEQLRLGVIPADILQIQKDFLKSLDSNKAIKPAYRKERYDRIADGEERLGRMAETNVVTFRTLVDYHSKLAEKYAKAEKEPWLPVEPDPPGP